MPTDPRDAVGVCGNSSPWTPPLAAWQTGGTGAGNIPASVTSALAWPPATISNGGPVSSLPAYTPTGAIPTLPGPTFAAATAAVNVGSGWANAADTQGLSVDRTGCQYLDPWVDPGTAPPPVCAAAARRRDELAAAPTPAP